MKTIPFIINGIYVNNCIRPNILILKKLSKNDKQSKDFKYGLYKFPPRCLGFDKDNLYQPIYTDLEIYRYLENKKSFQKEVKKTNLILLRERE